MLDLNANWVSEDLIKFKNSNEAWSKRFEMNWLIEKLGFGKNDMTFEMVLFSKQIRDWF